MKNDKVLLLELKERTSASGNTYLSGWLGKAPVVGFLDRESGEKVWQIYVSTPQPKSGQEPRSRRERSHDSDAWRRDMPPQSSAPGRGRQSVPAGELDDDIGDLGYDGR
jgi:hypothetical protein